MTKLTKKDVIDECQIDSELLCAREYGCEHKKYVELSRLVEARNTLKEQFSNEMVWRTEFQKAVALRWIDECFLGEQK